MLDRKEANPAGIQGGCHSDFKNISNNNYSRNDKLQLMSFSDFIEKTYSSPEDIVMEFIDDARSVGQSVGVLLPDVVALNNVMTYAANSETGINDKRQGYIAEIVQRRADGVCIPTITFNSFRDFGKAQQWNPVALLWKQYKHHKTGTTNFKPKYEVGQYQLQAEKRAKEHRVKREADKRTDLLGRKAVEKAAVEGWQAASECQQHEYLTSKDILPHGARIAADTRKGELYDVQSKELIAGTVYYSGELIIPLYKDGEIVSLQRILPGSKKLFLKGGSTTGCYYKLKGTETGMAFIAEGFATAATVCEATGHDVYCAFSANNLKAVVEAHPNIKAVAADAGSAGIQAAEATGLPYLAPPESSDGDDWNDYAAKYGLAAVTALLDTTKMGARPIHDVTAVEHKKINPSAVKIHQQIHTGLIEKFDIEDPAVKEAIFPSVEIIDRMIRQSFWSGSKSKTFTQDAAEALIQFSGPESFKYLTQIHGPIVNIKTLSELASQKTKDMSRAEQKSFNAAINAIVREPIIDHLKVHCQRESIAWSVDMFARIGQIKILPDKALVIQTHKPLKANTLIKQYDVKVINDFREHFTRFDEFLDFLVMARFAADRKKAYLWIHAESDWGKGFLKGMLNNLQIAVELSVKELERMFEGGPVSKQATDFLHAFVLVVDEFKSVKSELKQLEGSIRISPKNQLQAEVEVFAKLFLSADNVASLVGENGVEDQFANRMSVFREVGNITQRPVFKSIGGDIYLQHITLYAAERINSQVEKMRALGQQGASFDAENYLNSFLKRNGLDTVYQRFSESLPDLAENIVQSVMATPDYLRHKNIIRDGSHYYLTSATKVISDYIKEQCDQSEAGSLYLVRDKLAKLMCAHGKGSSPYRIGGRVIRAIKLKV